MIRLNKQSPSKQTDERGFVLVTAGLFMIVLLMLAGFAVDLGAWYLSASKLQRAADASALAGASSLPDEAVSEAVARSTFERNGYSPSGDGINVEFVAEGLRYTTIITDSKVPTYFLKLIKPSIEITRKSIAQKGGSSPALGSPYNVIGTGDLDIPNIPRQNFWLAVNGSCSAKEDGDYFTARYDGTKGPFLTTQDANRNYRFPSDAYHHCPPEDGIGEENPNYTPGGYSYFVDIPPTPSGSVVIRAYDSAFDPGRSGSIDKALAMGIDAASSVDTQFLVFDTNGTPEDDSDDGSPVAGKIVETDDPREGTSNGWIDLYTADNSQIRTGKQYRIQVLPDSSMDNQDGSKHGVNAFALAAFRDGIVRGCDTRSDPLACPRMYGRNAISIYNNLASTDARQVTYYFADIDAASVGTSMKLHLWDPGEGVEKLELVGPDGTPLMFNWTTEPDGPGYSGMNATSVETAGTGPLAQANLSNDYKFNDRLLTMALVVPEEYIGMVDRAGGRTGIQIRYTINDAPSDRTTWGMSMDSQGPSPARLLRFKP